MRIGPFVLVFAFSLSAFADVKITRTIASPAGDNTETVYFQASRSRMDFRNSSGIAAKPGDSPTIVYGPHQAVIYQCDQHRVLEVDLDHRQYVSHELDEKGAPEGSQQPAAPPEVRQSGVTVHVYNDVRDTGERKTLFGHLARHLIITRRTVPEPGACAQAGESTRDGWYIDFDEPRTGCMRPPNSNGPAVSVLVGASAGQPACIDHYVLEGAKDDIRRFAVEESVKSSGEAAGRDSKKQAHSFTSGTRVTELYEGPLDPALFELPTGFKHVDQLDTSPSLPWLLRGKMIWQNVKTTVWSWTPWGK